VVSPSSIQELRPLSGIIPFTRYHTSYQSTAKTDTLQRLLTLCTSTVTSQSLGNTSFHLSPLAQRVPPEGLFFLFDSHTYKIKQAGGAYNNCHLEVLAKHHKVFPSYFLSLSCACLYCNCAENLASTPVLARDYHTVFSLAPAATSFSCSYLQNKSGGVSRFPRKPAF